MTSLWSKLTRLLSTQAGRTPARSSRGPVRARLGLETLEDRTLLSGSPLGAGAALVSGPPASAGATSTGGGNGSIHYPAFQMSNIVSKALNTTQRLVTFTVSAFKPNGTAFTGYAGTVHFALSDTTVAATYYKDAAHTTALAGGNYTFTTGTGKDNGVHTFSMIVSSTVSQMLNVTDIVTGLKGQHLA